MGHVPRPSFYGTPEGTREFTEEEYERAEALYEAGDLDFTFDRAMRNGLLADSDWTQYAEDNSLSDEKKAEWATYRQALRDRYEDKTRVSELDSWPAPPS